MAGYSSARPLNLGRARNYREHPDPVAADSPAPDPGTSSLSANPPKELGDEFKSLGLPVQGGEFKEYTKDMSDQRTVWFEHAEGQERAALAATYRDAIAHHGYEECGGEVDSLTEAVTIRMCGKDCAAVEIRADRGSDGMVVTVERVDMPCSF